MLRTGHNESISRAGPGTLMGNFRAVSAWRFRLESNQAAILRRDSGNSVTGSQHPRQESNLHPRIRSPR